MHEYNHRDSESRGKHHTEEVGPVVGAAFPQADGFLVGVKPLVHVVGFLHRVGGRGGHAVREPSEASLNQKELQGSNSPQVQPYRLASLDSLVQVCVHYLLTRDGQDEAGSHDRPAASCAPRAVAAVCVGLCVCTPI